MIERFGDPDRLSSVSVSLVEDAAFGEGSRQLRTSIDGGRHHEGEPITGPLVGERLHQLPADTFGRAIVA